MDEALSRLNPHFLKHGVITYINPDINQRLQDLVESQSDNDMHPLGETMLGNAADEDIIELQARVLYKECYVAGLWFHNIKDVWDELYVGARLALVRDKSNKHDVNAVAVALADDYDGNPDDFDFEFILGYLPRTENDQISLMFDMGWGDMFECEISELNEHRPYKERVKIAIYIKSRTGEKRNTRIRALSINKGDLQKVQDDLVTRGNTYFRWGGFPPWEHDLPEKDENVLFIHKGKEQSVLYMMHLIAVGGDVRPYVEEGTEMCDDCCYYVFTNVMGPIKRDNSDLAFLEDEDIAHEQPELFLSQEATALVERIFAELK